MVAGTASALAECVAERARCQACTLLNTTGDLDRLCDNVDNGVFDGSCRGCLDGVVEGSEACDYGNQTDGDGIVCSDPACTTGPLGGPEECDDGNLVDDEECTSSCAIP